MKDYGAIEEELNALAVMLAKQTEQLDHAGDWQLPAIRQQAQQVASEVYGRVRDLTDPDAATLRVRQETKPLWQKAQALRQQALGLNSQAQVKDTLQVVAGAQRYKNLL